ncbi:MAG: Crp/Fnr family transcriptional regulator [Bacteroidaceae bacterium]|nr:Crp/Fnr family transcriptional regulator [Bacteroidaceae bacterium]
MEKRYEIAKQFSNRYHPLSPEDAKVLSFIMEPLKVAKGETFIKEGDVAHYIHYIEKGIVRQFYFKNKRDLTEHISYEGQVAICLESYLLDEPTRLMAEALEATQIWRVEKETFNQLTEKSREIELLYRKVFESSLLISQQKADLLRFETAHDRYFRYKELHPEVVRRAPLIHIASLLQMTPETLSRIRSGRV